MTNIMDPQDLSKAVEILRRGGLVAMPTETVYGLAADARQEDALRKIFLAKERPMDHPLIVHLSDVSQLSEWAVNISESAKKLAQHFWPGPLTLILKKAPHVSDIVTGGQDTIGLRIPNHPVARALLKEMGGGLAAPSANRFGRISPTTAEAVREELDDRVDLILDGGACDVGVESTIVDVSGDEVVVLRPGMISVADIEAVLKKTVAQPKKNSPRVSGSLESHYAPRTPTRLMSAENISSFLQQAHDFPVALMTRQKTQSGKNVFCVVMPEHAKEYAHELYQTLRELDKKNFQQIIVESVPSTYEWDAIRDRLERASQSK
jgi:L-threonylcarbamoyladenylate synthase